MWFHRSPPGWIVRLPAKLLSKEGWRSWEFIPFTGETTLAFLLRRRNMSSGQQQPPPPPRRITNVGFLLLTLQENESLFTFLGKKCVASALHRGVELCDFRGSCTRIRRERRWRMICDPKLSSVKKRGTSRNLEIMPEFCLLATFQVCSGACIKDKLLSSNWEASMKAL
ncbi:uncharacterized protein [Bos mutus]|uniref:uncharacterized protein isoform X2 n=1 Tax=Bos mutus TaxID=72004 RepID=UPI0038B4C58A